MKEKKLNEQISRIKSIMNEQETNEGILSDIKDYLLNKLTGIVPGNDFGTAMDELLSGGEEKIKSLYKTPEKSSKDMSQSEKRQIYSTVKDDEDFYAKVLWGLNLPVTKRNVDFLKLWRIAEMGYDKNSPLKKTATNNPLNTTQPLGYDTESTNFNSVGVKNYSRPEYGIEATVKTLKNGFYDCVLDGLRRELDYEEIAKCKTGNKRAMDIWGTNGDHLTTVIRTNKGKILDPKKIDMTIGDDFIS